MMDARFYCTIDRNDSVVVFAAEDAGDPYIELQVDEPDRGGAGVVLSLDDAMDLSMAIKRVVADVRYRFQEHSEGTP